MRRRQYCMHFPCKSERASQELDQELRLGLRASRTARSAETAIHLTSDVSTSGLADVNEHQVRFAIAISITGLARMQRPKRGQPVRRAANCKSSLSNTSLAPSVAPPSTPAARWRPEKYFLLASPYLASGEISRDAQQYSVTIWIMSFLPLVVVPEQHPPGELCSLLQVEKASEGKSIDFGQGYKSNT